MVGENKLKSMNTKPNTRPLRPRILLCADGVSESPSLALLKLDSISAYFIRLHLANQYFDVCIDIVNQMLTISNVYKNVTHRVGFKRISFTSSFIYTADGIQLHHVLALDNELVSVFRQLHFDETRNQLNFTYGKSKKGCFFPTGIPLYMNRTLILNFFRIGHKFILFNGFKKGHCLKYFALFLNRIHSGITFYPEKGISNNIFKLCMRVSDGSSYKAMFVLEAKIFKNRIILSELFRDCHFKEEELYYFNEFLSILLNSLGFYLVKTTKDSWDLVSAAELGTFVFSIMDISASKQILT